MTAITMGRWMVYGSLAIAAVSTYFEYWNYAIPYLLVAGLAAITSWYGSRRGPS
jgi:hypothetical protein